MRLTTCIVLCLTYLGQVSAQNFIVNGTFDTVVPTNGTGGSWTSFNLGQAGWEAAGGNPGARFLLNASGQPGNDPTIEQTIVGLTIGQSYLVQGDYLIHVPLGNPANSFGVLLDGVPILQLGNPGVSWTPFSTSFIATNTSHLIGLASERNGSDHSYYIDNIQVVAAVPEPTTILLISSTGLLGVMGIVRLRRRSRVRRKRKS